MAVAWTQVHFRARLDTQAEASADWMAALDTNASIIAGVRFRLRFDCSETGTTAATLAGQLRCAKNGGAFQSITASSTIAQSASSLNLPDGNATGQIISSGSFIAGSLDTVDGLCATTASIAQNVHTELEFCVMLVPTSVAAGDTVQFRVYVSPTTAFGTYTQSPTITVVPPLALGNYQGVRVPNGLSTGERIR